MLIGSAGQLIPNSADNLNRLLAQSAHMVQNNTCWEASCTVALPQWHFQNKGRSRWTGTSCFVMRFCATWPGRAKGLFKLSALFGINWHALSQSAFWDILIYIFMPRTDVAISKKLKWSYEIENNSRRLKLTEVQKDEIKCRTWN